MYVTNNNNTRRKFYRSRDKVFGGVCGGLAEYFGLDKIAVRLIALVALLFGSLGFWFYIIMWIATPLEPAARQ